MVTQAQLARERLAKELTRTRASIVALRLALKDAAKEPELFASLGDERDVTLGGTDLGLAIACKQLKELGEAV